MNHNDQEFLARKIRAQYLEKEHSQLDSLKELDAKVKRPANVFAYLYGSLGALVMGTGMSLVMTDVGTTLGMTDAMIPGIIIGIAGLGMALLTYPIHQAILNSRKKKYAKQIIDMSEKLLDKYNN